MRQRPALLEHGFELVERRVSVVAKEQTGVDGLAPLQGLLTRRLPVGGVPKNRVEIIGRGKGDVLDDDLDILCKPLQDVRRMDHLSLQLL